MPLKSQQLTTKALLPTASEKTRRGSSGDHGQEPGNAERQESDSLNSEAKRGDGVRAEGKVDLMLALLFCPPRSEARHCVQILLGKANHVAMAAIQQRWTAALLWVLKQRNRGA